MSDDEIWKDADRTGRIEVRQPCPHCGRGPHDKTLSLNTQKRVGYCHRCQWTTGFGAPEHFSHQGVVDLEEERAKRQFKYDKILETTQEIRPKDAAGCYLERRLGTQLPDLPRLGYSYGVRYYTGTKYATTPAMIGRLQDVEGRTAGLHITHLGTDGTKAYGSDSRRYCKLSPMKGCAIRLFPAGRTLIVAEGIETALALHCIEGDPAWACTSAALLRAFIPPPEVEHLIIAGDNDSNGVGQKAAYDLYHKYRNFIDCSVMVPDKENTDWLDSFRSKS